MAGRAGRQINEVTGATGMYVSHARRRQAQALCLAASSVKLGRVRPATHFPFHRLLPLLTSSSLTLRASGVTPLDLGLACCANFVHRALPRLCWRRVHLALAPA